MRSSPKIDEGRAVVEVRSIVMILLISAGEDGAKLTVAIDSFDVNDCTEESVGGTPFSSLLELLHFSDKGAAWINRVSIL